MVLNMLGGVNANSPNAALITAYKRLAECAIKMR